MNTREEKLSLLLDDRLSAGEASRLLDRMADDPELAAAWGRYQTVSSALRGQMPVMVDDGFAARISRQIAAEALPVVAVPQRKGRHWLRPVVGLALAATVSALAVLSVREFGTEGEPTLAEAWPAEAANVQKAGNGTLTQEQLDDYLKMHNDGVYFAGGGDLLPQARVAGYIQP